MAVIIPYALVKIDGKLHVAQYIIIPYGRIARGLISYMHIMPLVNQTDKSTAHGDHIIIRVRGKDDRAFSVPAMPFPAFGCRRHPAYPRPAGDGMLYLVKNIDVDIVYRPLLYRQLRHAMVVVIFFGQF